MKRRAYTLIETLVVFAVIGLIVALVSSAVSRVRQLANEISCKAKMKQISLASQNYHETYSHFPPAFRSIESRSSRPGLQWPILLSPFYENQAALTEAKNDFKVNRNPFGTPKHSGMNRVNSLFACPSDERLTTSWSVPFMTVRPRESMRLDAVFNSYLACSGTTSSAKDGVTFVDSKVAIIAVLDGTSNTILYGERPPDVGMSYGLLYAGFGQDLMTGSLDSVIGIREPNQTQTYRNCGPGPFSFSAHTMQDKCSLFHFWSPHTGGANFAFADGSVRFLRYSANDIMPALATRAGGEAVTVD